MYSTIGDANTLRANDTNEDGKRARAKRYENWDQFNWDHDSRMFAYIHIHIIIIEMSICVTDALRAIAFASTR